MPFRENPKLEDELKKEPEYPAALEVQAQRVAIASRSVAPVGLTSAYQGSIDTVVDEGEVAVITHDPFGHLVEWGSVNNPPYAPLRRGVRAAGLRLDEN